MKFDKKLAVMAPESCVNAAKKNYDVACPLQFLHSGLAFKAHEE
jgi:hypothetical protein